MHVPAWLTIGVALLVCVFGLYRISIAFRSDEEDSRARARKGLYAMGRRTHFLIGVIYLLLGGALVATTYGWSPLGGAFGTGTEVPSKDAAPTKGSAAATHPSPPASKPASKPEGKPEDKPDSKPEGKPDGKPTDEPAQPSK
jgi:uncharacterized iron-regulated membrane protein